MASYTHLNIQERELIFLYHEFGMSIRKIRRVLKRKPSTIMRELKRYTTKKISDSPSNAQRNYQQNKSYCGRKRILGDSIIKETVSKLFFSFR